MRRRVSADLHAAVAQVDELSRCQHQVVRQRCPHDFGELAAQGEALGRRTILELAEQRIDCRPLLVDRRNRVGAESDIPQVEIPPLATSHCLDYRVVPHPTAVEIAGGDEERRARIVSPHAESLELLSLDASRDGSTLAVTGVVRSRAEEPLTAVTAVISAIDAKGRPVGRGSVPLAAIRPRSESRFVVTISDVNEAARYRVSFRSATGVIRHVDRRIARTGDVS